MDSLRHLFPIAVFALFCLSLSTGDDKRATWQASDEALLTGSADRQRNAEGIPRLASAVPYLPAGWIPCAAPSAWPHTFRAPQRCLVS